MDLRLKTWNGNNINDGTIFLGYFTPGQKSNLSANPVTVNRAGDFPFLSTTVLNPHALVIGVVVLAGQNINAKREIVKQYFNITDRQRHNLVAWDAADSNRPYYVTGFPVRITPDGTDPNAFIIALQLEYPYWRPVTAATNNWTITATAQTHAVPTSGNISAPPSFAITPTTAATGGLSYRRWVPIYSNLDVSFVAPFDITDGGFDTATLTTAKMQADGDDLLVMEDGVFVDRWLDDMDTANTKVWVNLSLSPRNEGTTSTTIANTGAVATISLTETRANLKFLERAARATNKVVLIDSEAFTYTGADTVAYQLTGCTRAMKGTTAATHAAPKTVRWIEHDLWLVYGDSTLSAPDVDNANKPMFLLSSTNAAWSYANFYATTQARPGAWKGGVVASKSGLSYTFTGDQNTMADPATDMGMAEVGSPSAYNAQIETATLEWRFTHPAGVTAVVYSGKKYTTDTNSWPAIVGLQYLQPNVIWITQQNETVPSPALAWVVLGPHTETLPATYNTVRFTIDGSITPTSGARAMAQFDTVTVSLSTSFLPTVSTMGSEQAIVYLDFKLTNSTTGEYLLCETPCPVDETLTIDCENKEAHLEDGGRVFVRLSSERDAWLDLSPGSNTLKWDDAGTNGVTVTTTHRDRVI